MIQIKTIEEYHLAYQKSKDQPDLFWDEIASEFTWKKKWTKVMESDFLKGNSVWFKEAKLNITENCIDRHLDHNGNDIAIVWEPNNPSESGISLTYKELSLKVNQAAAILKKNGVKKGDRVGTVGNTGNALKTPSHLHFSISNFNPFKGKIYEDPVPVLNKTFNDVHGAF
jgi:acetyl-CoA synthetase